MIDLRDYARNKRPKEKTDVLTARLPVSTIQAFKELCDNLGLSVSEAIQLLVDGQLSSNGVRKNEDSTQKDIHIPSDEDEEDINVYKPIKTKPKKRTQTKAKRFNYTPWKIDGEVPCPICKEWISDKFSRHAQRKHGTTPEEIFTNEEYLVVVNEMIQQRKKEQSLSYME